MKVFEVIANIKNWNYDMCGYYKLNKAEAEVCLKALEQMKEQEDDNERDNED